jgi:N6-L-threonylcarbamoyladenine synthase
MPTNPSPFSILAIESSCDETAVAIVTDGLDVRSNIIKSQIKKHQKFGGVVPELASRMHAEAITPLIDLALEKANITFDQLHAIAVTHGPGLEGALLVGQTAAKTLAKALQLPLIPVNHLHGHIYATLLSHSPTPQFPFIALLVSGGHTQLIHAKDHFQFDLLGQTRDDAAGECFDKVARALTLGYPGGPLIEHHARLGNPTAFKFPKAMLNVGYEFSFSGIKTAVLQTIQAHPITPQLIQDISASFQKTVSDILLHKTMLACKNLGLSTVSISGGVSANQALKIAFEDYGRAHNIQVITPPLPYATDNAAMIGCAAYYQHLTYPHLSHLPFKASPNLKVTHLNAPSNSL